MQPGLPFDGTLDHGPSTDQAPSPRYPGPVFVRHPRARRYVVSVRQDGGVRVTLPRWGSMREAREFFGRLDGWIEQQRRRLDADRRSSPRVPDIDRRGAMERARQELPPRLHELARDLGLQVPKVSVRNQRWRWGSCSPRGHICLNWRLVTMPGWVRDYVLIHELMHLRRLDHSRKFWKLVADACPVYQDARRWLREHGRSL